MIIGLQKFTKYMDKLMKSFDLENDLNDVLTKYKQETRIFNDDSDMVKNLLYEMFDDKEGLISYYIYEANFGRDFDKCPITDCEGNEVSLRNPEELYNLLIENMED